MQFQFRYHYVISVCGLEPDLRELANGDKSEVSFITLIQSTVVLRYIIMHYSLSKLMEFS